MDKNKVGILLFIGSEAVFFSLLIIAYASFRNAVTTGPTAAQSLDPLRTGIFSLFLFSSSFTVWRADKNIALGNYSRLKIWLSLTILLGLVFLAGQGLEWTHLINQGITASRNLFGTTFFTLTGFHGLHVIIGLVMLSILLGMAVAVEFKSPHSAAVESISLYWHFVDVVWVVIFSIVYLTIVLRQ